MDLNNHPCFNAKMKGKYGRVHLPVAPRCNIQCRYCDRKYDCVNESRPGVTSGVLTPDQAMVYLAYVLKTVKNISVAGIAGPGDPFANANETMETLRKVRAKYPDMILCLATNGLGVSPYIKELSLIGVSHVTITINAVDPSIAKNIYAYVRYGKRVLGSMEGAKILLAKQLEAIEKLKEAGITTKVNTVIIPGINDEHIEDVAIKMSDLGVDILNCIPIYPCSGSSFGMIEEPPREMVRRIRNKAGKYLPQMYHCTRCRADAVGILGETNSQDLIEKLQECVELPEKIYDDRFYVAVASREGTLVNEKLGKARNLLIYGKRDGNIVLIERRKTPEPGNGFKRWEELAELIKDCRAILVSGIGNNPRKVLDREGIDILEVEGLIDEAVEAVFDGHSLNYMIQRDIKACNSRCSGSGMGCM